MSTVTAIAQVARRRAEARAAQAQELLSIAAQMRANAEYTEAAALAQLEAAQAELRALDDAASESPR